MFFYLVPDMLDTVLQTNKNHVAYLAPDRLDSVESLMRSLGSKLLFTDTKSAVLACVIIYMFR